MAFSIRKSDVICLSETYLDSNILPDDSNLEIPGYNLLHSDHPSNKKTWSCLYILHKSFALNNHWYQLFKRVHELMVGDKLCNNTMFLNSSTVKTGISGHHRLICRMLRSTFCKVPAKFIYYRSYNNYKEQFENVLKQNSQLK